MSQVYLLQNQHKQLLNKQGEWSDGRDAAHLFRTVHRDEALNQMIEVNARDYTLRIKILECPTNDRGVPQIADEDLPPMDLLPAEDEPQSSEAPEGEVDEAVPPEQDAAESQLTVDDSNS